jgi:hypothetical protein
MSSKPTWKKTKKGVTVVQCDKCLSWVKSEHDEYGYADGGSQLTIHGGYGEFIDVLAEDEEPFIQLCHDCTLELFRSIPKLSPELLKNGHSVSIDNPSYPLCCEYSWGFNSYDDQGNLICIYGDASNFKPQQTFELEND